MQPCGENGREGLAPGAPEDATTGPKQSRAKEQCQRGSRRLAASLAESTSSAHRRLTGAGHDKGMDQTLAKTAPDRRPDVRGPRTLRRYRAVFISDVHLGTKISRPGRLVEFLKGIRVERLYLVGDIIDLTALRRRFYWDQEHNQAIRRILKMVKRQVRVIYIPGNHDRDLRDFHGINFSGIEFKNRDIHITGGNRRMLVIHGDEFDGVLREQMAFLYTVGDYSYVIALWLSRIVGAVTRRFGVNFSLSHYLKTRVKNVLKFINDFEQLLVLEARAAHADGVICGHIHSPALQMIGDKQYANCGCWTESCSALVEHLDGTLEVIKL